jgi:hypothetical protein
MTAGTPTGAVTHRTAPRSVEDCPKSKAPDAWKQDAGVPPAGFDDPHEAIKWAQMMQRQADDLLRVAAVALVDQGHNPVEAAAEAGISDRELQESIAAGRRARERLEYSQEYYGRHPDRTPGEWYPVEDGDPEMPDDTAFGTRSRRTT